MMPYFSFDRYIQSSIYKYKAKYNLKTRANNFWLDWIEITFQDHLEIDEDSHKSITPLPVISCCGYPQKDMTDTWERYLKKANVIFFRKIRIF